VFFVRNINKSSFLKKIRFFWAPPHKGFKTFWRNQMPVTQTTTQVTSSSILFLSPVTLGPPAPGLFCRQSLAICPAPPQLEHTMLFVTFGLSGHCNNQSGFNDLKYNYFIQTQQWTHITAYHPWFMVRCTTVWTPWPFVFSQSSIQQSQLP